MLIPILMILPWPQYKKKIAKAMHKSIAESSNQKWNWVSKLKCGFYWRSIEINYNLVTFFLSVSLVFGRLDNKYHTKSNEWVRQNNDECPHNLLILFVRWKCVCVIRCTNFIQFLCKLFVGVRRTFSIFRLDDDNDDGNFKHLMNCHSHSHTLH